MSHLHKDSVRPMQTTCKIQQCASREYSDDSISYVQFEWIHGQKALNGVC